MPDPPVEPVLPVDDVQGDVLAGFRKDHETFLFFRIVDVPATKRSVRELLSLVSPLRDVAAFNAVFRSVCLRRGEIRGTLVSTWLNIGFTAAGLTALTSRGEVGRFADRSFQLGLARRSTFIGDPIDGTHEGHPNNWHFGGPGNPVDIVVLVAGDDPAALAALADTCEHLLEPGCQVVWREVCQSIPDTPGHEHFGFKDGIAQPGIRGRVDESNYLTRREIAADPAEPRTLMYARRGQPLVWPGQFVLGLERQRQSFTDPTPLPPLPVAPAWAAHGSLLVIRRLRQDVDGFRRFVDTAAEELDRIPGFSGMSPQRLAALLVGRWSSGAPLVRAPDADDARLGAASGPNNAFGYLNEDTPLPQVPGVPPDEFPAATPDPGGQVCPHGAHIRKMDPRDQAPGGSTTGNTLTHLILRRGLTFDHTGTGDPAPAKDKGLLFACYQASIRQGFEFLSTQWANNPARPLRDPGGLDLLVGRLPARMGASRRALVLIGRNGERFELATFQDWVIPNGGGYFFVPSLAAIRDVLTQ